MSRIILLKEEDKKFTKLQKAYEVASKMALRYGSPYSTINGEYVCRYEEKHIRRYWRYDETAPPPFYFQKNTNIKTIRQIIQQRANVSDEIWNPDFINGLCLNGEILETSEKKYKHFTWKANSAIEKILNLCPYGGDIRSDKWANVPILDVQYSDDSFSYMAGLFIGGEITQKNYRQYAVYRGKAKDEIVKRRIPLEYESHNMVMISPVWPALFAPFMPAGRNKTKWKACKNPVNGEFYSALLWKSYMDNKFPVNGLPFLKSRRSIYYKYKCKEGAMKKLESLRISTGLVEIDIIFSDIVKHWGGNL
jgi:hypothetical protein